MTNNNIWDRMRYGDQASRIKSGYMILGPNSSDGTLSDWHCDELDGPLGAIAMATHFSRSSGSAYEILKYEYIGLIRPAPIAIEFLKPEQKTVVSDQPENDTKI